MAHVDDLKQSKFFGKPECRQPVWMTIKGCGEEPVKQQNGPDKNEIVLYFHENEKPFILKSTNGQLIATFTGQMDYEKWQGVKIELWVDPTIDFSGKIIGGVRVRQAVNPQGLPPASVPTQAPPSTYMPPPEFHPTPPKDDDIPF